MVLSTALWVRSLIFILFITALMLRHLTGPILDLGLYVLGGLLTAGLTILGGHVSTEKREYRLLFYVLGFALATIIVATGIPQYQAAMVALAAPTPEQIVMRAVGDANQHTDTAVDGANKHTDSQVAMVRDDLKGATTHSDQQIGMVRGDLKGVISTFTELFSKTESDLGTAISKVNKPDPPERARLQFSLWGDGKLANFPLTTYAMKPDKDGVFDVEFYFNNPTGTAASKIDFWAQVCQACSYAKEPTGFDRPSGLDEHVRHRVLPGFINPGTSFEKNAIAVKMDKPLPYFEISFRYSCETCGPISEFQTVRIIVLP
jgi:hypothetical protein